MTIILNNTGSTYAAENHYKKPLRIRIKRDFKTNGTLYLLALPVLIFYILFHYKPLYGVLIAFMEYSPTKGMMASPWVGFKHFADFLSNPYFFRLLGNTLKISLSMLAFSFPAPIILALLINEIDTRWFRNSIQTVFYLPNFISLVVICGMIINFTAADGIINDFVALVGGNRVSFLNYPQYFLPVYVISDIWTTVGWGSIVYIAALTAVDRELYEAAVIDGAGRWKQTLHVTIPGILPTVIVMLLLRIGSLLNVGYEKIILLYNPITYETADVISTYVYRKGLLEQNWSYSTAVGLFNSIINFILLIGANQISKRFGDGGLW